MAKQKPKTTSRSTPVRFALDGEIVTLEDVDPTRTVLQLVREDLGRIGTKEGCAEGDCGACTVVVGELAGNGIRFRAINSCIQFVPTLDGKELITVESLQGDAGALHPVQQALVDCHGSQCGFCTPGFVMSLFALYKSAQRPSRRAINDALAGNLCRCTGYRPIVDAACRMYDDRDSKAAKDENWMNCSFSSPTDALPLAGEQAMIERLRAIRRTGTLTVAHGTRSYFAPASLAELAAMREAKPAARLLAGGTDVGLWVTKQLRELPSVIYVGNVAELAQVDVVDDALRVGAAVSLTDAFAALVAHYPDLDELCRRFASPPIRNAGTLGGNVANGSPIGDSMPVLLALGATLTLRRGACTRELPLDEFYLGYQKTALGPGEFLERVSIPLRKAPAIVRSYKVSKRFDQDIAAVCGGYCIHVVDGIVQKARVAYGGVAAIPKRAKHCENALAGKPWSEPTVRAAMNALDRDYTPLTDMRASAAYRRRVTKNLLFRLFVQTTKPGHAINLLEFAEAAYAS
ncbi:MAG TPA: xanthine dehydrogenase small subunit [Casimicrobiaceae bacterium]|jgi:xanthine dehydrogenase small subunit